MGSLETSVKKTRLYATFFNFPLDATALFRWLITPKPVSSAALARFTKPLSEREADEISTRRLTSDRKITLSRRAVSFISLFPTVRLVAITGSLAVKNARPDDDVDLMIITSPNSLWLTRLFLVPLLGLFFKRRLPAKTAQLSAGQVSDAICLNLWLDESALMVPPKKQNLYTAHEVLQALPIFDRGGVYQKFIQANDWTKNYLANAYQIATQGGSGAGADAKQGETSESSGGAAAMRKRAQAGTRLREIRARISRAANPITTLLNSLAFKLQYSYMKKKITNETITLHSAYFHPRDLSRDIEKYLR